MSVKPHDELRVRKAVRACILEVLTSDLFADLEIVRKAWQECADVAEQQVAEDELKEIIKLVESRGPAGF